MAAKRKHYSGIYKAIQLLRIERVACILLCFSSLFLQGYNVFYYKETVMEIPTTVGSVSFPFQFTGMTAVPFLMLPMVLLAILDLLLSRFFERNSGTARETITSFERNPHTRVGKRISIVFAGICVVLSLLLACLTVAKHVPKINLLSCVTLGGSVYILLRCSKTLRRRKRQYLHHKKHLKNARERA